ncbi:hypothetical protein M011DRAFT_405699 [Sporormia fimetaria CBS 119925]|uniref:Rhodopsin domain-containing protein n=1 Tax=Sporormia fimetaria CBS 119925 TaxID=1340428 RepID=A0A6A6V7B8_9PLEO|nr:hypothetical protein M011DRAFT_405699 [Sporormia fimetaria CBS 119925]
MSNPFQTEAWTEYGLGMIILLTRIGARCWQKGLDWDGDDYFAAIAVFFFTGELVMLELIGEYGSITGMSDEIALKLTDEQRDRIVFGSKCLLAGWILYTTLIWCLKACMLFFYKRLTLQFHQNTMVKVTGGVCVAAYIATITVFLTHCHPITRLWQVYPYPGNDCAQNISKYLALVVTNVTTDLMILYIPLPILWNVQLPWKKKLLCAFWLCTGVFIVIATLLRCILCLQDVNQINVGTIWSIRETFVGIIAVNLPVLKPFLTRATRRITSIKDSKTKPRESDDPVGDVLRFSKVQRRGKKRSVHALTENDDSSQEHIVGNRTQSSATAESTSDLRSVPHGESHEEPRGESSTAAGAGYTERNEGADTVKEGYRVFQSRDGKKKVLMMDRQRPPPT